MGGCAPYDPFTDLWRGWICKVKLAKRNFRQKIFELFNKKKVHKREKERY